MRALFISDLKEDSAYSLTGDYLHHLVHVVRVEHGENLLLLNGSGLQIKTKIELISKRELQLKYIETLKSYPKSTFDLALGIPKKEALELCLKQATEIGFRKIILIRGEYSQTKIPELDRVQKLLISALEQSNGAYLPEIEVTNWENIDWDTYSSKILLDTQGPAASGFHKGDSGNINLLIVGPEGGFAPEELELFRKQANIECIQLPTPILRTPTALAVGAGILLERLMD